MSSLSCDFFGPQGRCFSRNEFAHVKADVGVGDEIDAGGGDLIQLDLKADEIHVSEGPTHVEQQIDVRTRPVTADGDSNEDSDVRLTRPPNDNAVDPDRYPPSSRGQKHRHMERSRTRPDAIRPRHGLRQAVPAMGGAHDPAHAAQGQPDRADRPGVDTGPRWP